MRCECVRQVADGMNAKKRCAEEVRFSVATGKRGHGKRRGVCWLHYKVWNDNKKDVVFI